MRSANLNDILSSIVAQTKSDKDVQSFGDKIKGISATLTPEQIDAIIRYSKGEPPPPKPATIDPREISGVTEPAWFKLIGPKPATMDPDEITGLTRGEKIIRDWQRRSLPKPL